MANIGGKFRKKTKFTQVSNTVIRDTTISFKAKGLYLLIQSYITLENFDIYKGFLMKQCCEKTKAFDSAWKELKTKGYLKQYRIPTGENGTFEYEYDLLDVADLTTPALVNCNKNGDVIDKSVENDHTPQNVCGGNSTECLQDCMQNGGDISNTNYNNTDLNNINLNKTVEDVSKSTKNTQEPIAKAKDQAKQTEDNIIAKIHKTVSVEHKEISKDQVKQIINNIKAKQDLSKIKNLFSYFTQCVKNKIEENNITADVISGADTTANNKYSFDLNKLDELVTYGKI